MDCTLDVDVRLREVEAFQGAVEHTRVATIAEL
jgi:hypothetical protein